jgi:hypothetical protein
MENNQQIIGQQDFVNTRGVKCIGIYNVELHGFANQVNAKYEQLVGLPYYYNLNHSHIAEAVHKFGERRYRKYNDFRYIQKNCYFRISDLERLGISYGKSNAVKTTLKSTNLEKYRRSLTSIVSEDEKFECVNSEGTGCISFLNAKDYGLVFVPNSQVNKYTGLRYFWGNPNSTNYLKRSRLAFKAGQSYKPKTSKSQYWFYKQDIELRDLELASQGEIKPQQENNIFFKPSLATPPTLIQSKQPLKSDAILQLVIELEEAEAKVFQIKEAIKQALSL